MSLSRPDRGCREAPTPEGRTLRAEALRRGEQTLSSLGAPQAAETWPLSSDSKLQPHRGAAGSFLLGPRGATGGALSSRGTSEGTTFLLLTRGIRVDRTSSVTHGASVWTSLPLLTQGVHVDRTPSVTHGASVWTPLPQLHAGHPCGPHSLLTRGIRVDHTPSVSCGASVWTALLQSHAGRPCGPHSLSLTWGVCVDPTPSVSRGASLWTALSPHTGASMWTTLPHPTWGHQNRLYFSLPVVTDQSHLQSQTFLKTLEGSDEMTAGAD